MGKYLITSESPEDVELTPASDAKEIANNAYQKLELDSVAASINYAASTGSHCITYSHELMQETKQSLEDNGYTVTPDVRAADPTKSWIIGGF